jgi:hypothetical protein
MYVCMLLGNAALHFRPLIYPDEHATADAKRNQSFRPKECNTRIYEQE